MTLRCEASTVPVPFTATTPDVTVNLTSPQLFGKFAPQTTSSYSTMGSFNGQLFIMGRFEF